MRGAVRTRSQFVMPAPARVGLARAMFEAAAGYAVVLSLAATTHAPAGSPATAIAFAVAWAWLVLWPAWRLRCEPAGSVWRRISTNSVQTVVAAVVLGLTAVIVTVSIGAPLMPSGHAGGSAGVFGLAIVLFVVVRTNLLVILGLRRRIRRRLRWQLTASHLAVIMLTFIPMMAVASVAGISVLTRVVRPNAPTMARSVVDLLRVAHVGPGDPNLRSVLNDIANGTIALRGVPPVSALAPRRGIVPERILVLTTDGRVVAAAANAQWTDLVAAPATAAPIPAAEWRRIRDRALSGQSVEVSGVVRFASGNNPATAETALGETPLLDASGRARAVAVVEVANFVLPGNQLFAVALAIFGVSTVAVIATTALPILALSGLFGYLMARGMTSRLEAVSTVTTAIAAGDLTRRAPVKAENEVGRLADDVNHMADHLERTMGELLQARSQAERALRARQELVANISHELRTPLAVIRAHLDTLAMRRAAPAGSRGIPDADVSVPESTLYALQNETQRLASLVEDLFSLSGAQTGDLRVQIRSEPVDVIALLGDVATLMRPLAHREGRLTLSVQSSPGRPLALADPDRLRQIVENLVRNAVRHTPDGGIIVLSAHVQSPWVVVAVADTGEGIAAEHLPHIFDRFYRVDQSRSRGSGGAGLGLAIVREFVELMGGRVTVESTLGEGTRFSVFLPQAAA